MLMRKDPQLRFRHAADAAHALLQLREPTLAKRKQRRVIETIDQMNPRKRLRSVQHREHLRRHR